MKNEPVPYYHKPPLRSKNYDIHYNRDYKLTHIVPNRHDYYEFYFLVSGNVTYSIESKSFLLAPGDIVLIAPGQFHEATIHCDSSIPYERYVLWLNPSYLMSLSSASTNVSIPFLRTDIGSPHLRITRDMQIFVHRLMSLIHDNGRSQEYGADLLMNAYVTELLICIARIKLFHQPLQVEQNLRFSSGTMDPLVIQILDYINEHIYEEIRIQDLAETFFVSRSHVCKKFSEALGIPIHQFIKKKKLFLAKQDLSRNISIGTIIERYGWGTYSSFFRAFKAEFGNSPRNFQKTLI